MFGSVYIGGVCECAVGILSTVAIKGQSGRPEARDPAGGRELGDWKGI